MKCNHDDCFTCPYSDCIITEKQLRKQTKTIKDYRHEYYLKNREKLLSKSKELQRQKREAKMTDNQRTCFWCHKVWDSPRDVLYYKRHYFCDKECLGEFLCEKNQEDIRIKWFDTEENMRICAEEVKHEW